MTTPLTTVRITPGMRNMLIRSAVGVAAFATIFLVLGLFWPPMRLLGFVVALVAVGYGVYIVLYIRRALIAFGDGTYRVREAITDRRFTVADVELVVPVDELAIPGQASPALVVIGTSPRRRLVEINGASFGTSALELLAGDLQDRGARLDHLTGRVTPAEFSRRYPRILGLTAQPRGLRIGMMISIVVLAVVSGLVGR